MRLPETWAEIPLSRVAEDIQPGFAQAPGDENADTVPQIRTHNVSPEGQLTLEGIKHVTPSPVELEKYSLVPGDIVFNNTNSEEWVGKTAVFREHGQYVFSNHMTRIRVRAEIADPDYIAWHLHFLWAIGYSRNRAKRWVSQAAIDGPTLAKLKLVLPSLPEQQRISEVLRQADRVGSDRRKFGEKVQAILHSALDRVLFAGEAHSLRTLSGLVETRYGTSVSAEADEASGWPVLRIPNVVTGEVNSSDIKYVALPPTDIERLLLKYGDVLVVRSNGNPDYVGRSAPVTDILTRTPHVYASYLIRLRANIDELLPEYLSSYLNSPYGRAAMRNAIRTTAGQSNLSGESLSRVKIPLPPIEQQRFFARVWNSLQDLRVLAKNADELGRELVCTMRGDAFTGALTEQWRARYGVEVHKADAKRRAAPRKGADRLLVGITEHAQVERKTVLDPPARAWLASQLSEFQRNVWLVMREWKGSVVPDDTEGFANFCSNPGTAWPIEHEGASPDRIKRTLEQLAALGLIAKVQIPNTNGKYTTAFRPLREGEDTRLADASRLETLLRQETE